MTVHIAIEEVVLRGVSAADAPLVVAALRHRLTELAMDSTPTARTADSYRPRPVPAATPAELGAHAAAAIWDVTTGRAS
jgi:hypothetical protein